MTRKDLLKHLIEASVATANINPEEIADFAEKIYEATDYEQWAVLEVNPAALIDLFKKNGAFEGWTAKDNEIAGRYALIATEPPPVVFCFVGLRPPSVTIIDGRHRLVSRKNHPSISVAIPNSQISLVPQAIRVSSTVKK